MTVNPYLFFDGQCEEAVNFYAKCFGATILGLMRYSGAPGAENMSPETQNRVMHTALRVGNNLIMASDAPHERYERPQGISVSVDFDQPAEAERVFAAMSEGALVQMPMAETFWADRFGTLTDRFGIPWMIGASKKQSAAAA